MNRIKKQLSIWLAPVLLAVFPTLSVYTHNMAEAELSRTFIPVLYSLVFAAVSGCVFFVIFRDQRKASLFTSLWTILFFSFGYIYLEMDRIGFLHNIPLSLNKQLLGAYALILFFTGWHMCRTKRTSARIIAVTNMIALVLVGYNLALLIPFNIKHIIISRDLQKHQQANLTQLINSYSNDNDNNNNNTSSYPDIYYIIFDRYARQDVLGKYFDFNNQPILDYLTNEGFFIAAESQANYPNTFQSLASSLNFSYLDFLTSITAKSPNDRLTVYQNLIQQNTVAAYLKQNGYHYVLMSGFWDGTKNSPLANETVNLFSDFDELQLYIFERTLVNVLRGVLESKQLFTGQEKADRKILNVANRMFNFSKKEKESWPKFVFGHFLIPHDPNIFSDNCSPFDYDPAHTPSEEYYYLQELQCANRLMQEITAEIKKTATRPAVIIFQSDEGPFLPTVFFGGQDVYRTEKLDEALAIHTPILNAVYLSDPARPGQPADYARIGLTPGLTPVNTFRLIFNYYFKTDLPPLDNKSYYFPDSGRPYEWEELALP